MEKYLKYDEKEIDRIKAENSFECSSNPLKLH